MKKSISYDLEKKYEAAVKEYEHEIYSLKNAGLEEFINLSFLYWSFATQLFEFNIPNSIPESLQEIGTKRYSKILDDGIRKYPQSVELNFWKKYFNSQMYFEDFSEQKCLYIINKYSIKSLVPYFYLSLLDEKKYSDEIKDLATQCNKSPTAKNLYIKTFLKV